MPIFRRSTRTYETLAEPAESTEVVEAAPEDAAPVEEPAPQEFPEDAGAEPVEPAQQHEEAAADPSATGMLRRSLDEQRAFLLEHVRPLRPFAMQIWDVPGLVLSEDITSDLDLPLVTTARVEGWGVRGSDLVGAKEEQPRGLYLVDTISVSDGPTRPLVAGAVVRVEEGAILPEGVDVVVPLADGELGDDEYVRIGHEARMYDNVRRAGSELADGTPLLKSGEVLTPRSVAVLAEVGIDKVMARPRPRVAVMTVGESLVAPGKALTKPQQRYDAASALISAAARNDGAVVYPLGIVPANPDAVRRAVADQEHRADLIVVIGGGELIREVADDLGNLDEAIVAVNRESRIAFSAIGAKRVPLVILPPGVVSSFVGYQALLRPVINKLNNVDPLQTPTVEGRLVDRTEGAEGITQFIPAFRDADGNVRPVAAIDTEIAWDLHRANVLAIIPSTWAGAEPGSKVTCIVLDDASSAPLRS